MRANASEAENKLMAPPTTRASWVWTHTRDRWTMDASMPRPAQSTPVRARLKGGACFPAYAKEGAHWWAEVGRHEALQSLANVQSLCLTAIPTGDRSDRIG